MDRVVVAIMAFFVMWPPGPVFAVVLVGDCERKVVAVADAGHRSARETGVVAMGVDV
jgi:hypothetical protein